MKKFVYKYLIFGSLLFCTFGTATIKSAINNNKIKVESLIGESLSKEDQEFIDNIAKELDITNSVEAYYMNAEAQRIFGMPNIVAYQEVLLISPYFLQALSTSEKKFIITRELWAAYSFRHWKNIKTSSSSTKAIMLSIMRMIPLGFIGYTINRYGDMHRILSGIFKLLFLMNISIDLIDSRLSAKREAYKYDIWAACKINDLSAAINYLETCDKYNSKKQNSSFLAMPTFRERINALKKGKYLSSNVFLEADLLELHLEFQRLKKEIDRLERLKVENQEIYF